MKNPTKSVGLQNCSAIIIVSPNVFESIWVIPRFCGEVRVAQSHAHPHNLYILSVDIWISLYRDLFKNALKYLKNNLRCPFENYEFTPLFYRITKTFLRFSLHLFATI
jgi:hypothetical protein